MFLQFTFGTHQQRVVELQGEWRGSRGHLYHHSLVAAFLFTSFCHKTKGPGRWGFSRHVPSFSSLFIMERTDNCGDMMMTWWRWWHHRFMKCMYLGVQKTAWISDSMSIHGIPRNIPSPRLTVLTITRPGLGHQKVPPNQWLFLVPLKGGRWHIIPQLAVYTTYIPLIYCLLGGEKCYLPPFRGTRNNHWSKLLDPSTRCIGWKVANSHPFLSHLWITSTTPSCSFWPWSGLRNSVFAAQEQGGFFGVLGEFLKLRLEMLDVPIAFTFDDKATLKKNWLQETQLMATFWSNYSDLTRPGPPNGGLVRDIPGYFRKIQVGEIF